MDEEARRKLSNERDKFTKRVVSSHHLKKLIVACPGTGKTYTFQKILERKDGTCLVLTFINNLVSELREQLGENARIYTFHAFCIKLLHELGVEGLGQDFVVFPALSSIIQYDAQLLINEKPNFVRLFRKLDLTTENHDFFLERSDYYRAVSFSDSVFRILKYLYENRSDIPTYPQILVDEYQDFNRLEVSLLDLLSGQSPILIVGDDDQALYGNIRSASPKYIRNKHHNYKYKNFQLPFCSRCTQVVINAMKDIVGQAQDNGKLSERIQKPYRCFTPAKKEDNNRFSNLTHAYCTVQRDNAPYIPKFIEEEISSLKQDQITQMKTSDSYPVLVAGPHRYLKMVDDYFGDKDSFQIHYEPKEEKERSENISLRKGYERLLEMGKYANLGWRIILECDPLEGKEEIINKARGKRVLHSILPPKYCKEHLEALRIFRKAKEGKKLIKKEEDFFKDLTGVDLETIINRHSDENSTNVDNEGVSIKLATYVGCKGLSAGFVFIVGMNEGILPKDNSNPANEEIKKCIVALTRTVKKCCLITTGWFGRQPQGDKSIFIDWIEDQRLQKVEVSKDYWN